MCFLNIGSNYNQISQQFYIFYYLASIYRGYNIHSVTIDPRHTGKGKPLNPNPLQKAVRGKKQLQDRGSNGKRKMAKNTRF